MKSQPRRKRFPCGEIFEQRPRSFNRFFFRKELNTVCDACELLLFFLVFGLSVVFVFVLGSKFVFGLRLGFGFGFFLLNWIFFRHHDLSEPLVTESFESRAARSIETF